MGPTRGPSGPTGPRWACRPQVGPMLAPWTLLSWWLPQVIHCGGFHPRQLTSHPALRLSISSAIWDPLSGDYWHLSWQMSDPMYDGMPAMDGFVQKKVMVVWWLLYLQSISYLYMDVLVQRGPWFHYIFALTYIGIWNLKLWNKLQWNSNQNFIIFIQENAFEIVVCHNSSHFVQEKVS